ncbi:MAG TPA: RDD family protein [Pyrinomonadaceae bacterium]|nr:RDD family protein [Pyrinomonadaceae bacterium]
MSSRIERSAVPAKAIRTEQVIVDFDAERLKAPFLLRCGALLIDYILLVSVPVVSLLFGRYFEYDGAKLLNSEISNAGWLILILLVLTNFVIFPMFSGQTIGKILTGLKIVNIDGNAASFSRLLIRHLIGYPLTVITFGLGFLFSVLNQNGRALHDFLAGTIVVYGRRRKLS